MAGSTDRPPSGTPYLVLVNPPARRGYSNERTYSGGVGVSRKLKPLERERPIIMPIDVLYTAAAAERGGARVELVDLLLEGWQGSRALRACGAAIERAAGAAAWVGVRLSMPSLPRDLAFANRLKELRPDARIFVFGTVIMATVDHWIHDCRADFVLYGEPEVLIEEVLRAPDYRRVAGVICPRTHVPLAPGELYNGDANSARYGQWVRAHALGELPRPAWHLLDMGRYSTGKRNDPAGVTVFVQASRGCPIACTMCPYMLLEGKPWRSNGIEAVVDEIEYLNRTFGIYHVRFRDPNFGFNRKYARELGEALIRRGVKLEATVETSVEVLDEETLRTMYAAGIRTITTGIETNDAECMASIGQKIAVNDKLRARLALCHEIGFHIYGTFCLGTPEESWATVRKTWEFANELDVESGFTVMTPFPGTPMYWRAIDEGLLPRQMRFSDWNSYTATMGTRHLTPRDLDVARLWARLETILPYRARRARPRGALALLRFYVTHAPHLAVRLACRAYVAMRRSRPSPAAAAERGRSSAQA